jgi:hypothetical protein
MILAKRAVSLWPKYAVRMAMVAAAAFITPLAIFVLACDEALVWLDQWENE